MSLTNEDLERLCSPSYLDGLKSAVITELRERRDTCQRAELVLSYLRRVVQGEIDLVAAELEHRRGGGTSDVARLVEALPAILAPAAAASQPAHLPALTMDPAAGLVEFEDGPAAEQLLVELAERQPTEGASVLLTGANLCAFSDEELSATLERLQGEERSLSRRRRLLHEQIDEIQATIVDRYKSGSADPDALLS